MYKFLQVKKFPLYDVFTDDGRLDDQARHGWRNWSRVKIVGDSITVISGTPLSENQLSQIHKLVKGSKVS